SAKLNEVEEDPTKTLLTYNHLYQSETLASFFRRPDITPDGALIITPAGIYKESESDGTSYSVHIYPRNRLLSPPLMRLTGFPKPPIAIRCSPIMYKLEAGSESVLSLGYRCVFAVATQNSVFVYNTQHLHPIAFASNLHHASLTDLSWSCDGLTLLASSADGFASILRFSSNELGVPLPKPLPTKASLPALELVEPIDLAVGPSPTILTPKTKVSVLDMMRSTPTLTSNTTPPQQDDDPQVQTTPSKKRRIVPIFVSNLN
ncbi:Chromatin assembly factor 1 subunit, partial [Massospora cicadina]